MRAVFGHSFYVKAGHQRLIRWSLTTTTVAIAGYWLGNFLTGEFLNHGRPILIAASIGFLSCLWLTLALLCVLRLPIGRSPSRSRQQSVGYSGNNVSKLPQRTAVGVMS